MALKSVKGTKKFYIITAIVLAAALGIVYFLYGGTGFLVGQQDAATQNIKDIYRLITDQEPEILSVKEESGIYRVVIRTVDVTGNSVAQDIFITKDGKFITDKLLDAEQYRSSLESSKNFVGCLSEDGVRIVGQSNQNYTLTQMQILGSFGYKIYFDCLGDNLAICQQLGIKTVPSVIYNQTIYEGIKSVEWFENLTGCSLQ